MADSTNIIAATIGSNAASVFTAPLGTTLPTDAKTVLDAAFKDLGWVGEDGVTNGINRETTKHYAWGGSVVKTTQDRYTETVGFSLLESSIDVLKLVYGDSNVVDNGGVVSVKHTEAMLPRQVIVVDFEDGPRFGRIVIPECQISEIGDLQYTHKGLLQYELMIDIYKAVGHDELVEVFLESAPATRAHSAPSVVVNSGSKTGGNTNP